MLNFLVDRLLNSEKIREIERDALAE